MLKKVFILLLVCCLFIGIKQGVEVQAAEFGEAPMLAEKVKAGELPPVAERLPEEPFVVKPIESIGKYGGTWRDAYVEYAGDFLLRYYTSESIINLDYDHATPIPSVIKSWEWLDDNATELLFHLRKGMKWSDGQPVTADDWLFWFEDVTSNEEMTPTFPAWLTMGDEKAQLVKVDDYTIKWTFPTSYGIFPSMFANWPRRGVYMVLPKHYLKQFHPKYTAQEQLDKLIQEGQYDSWADLFESKSEYVNNPEKPTLRAWIVESDTSGPVQTLVRNPYYWKVDSEGNQLPYIDKWERVLVGDFNGVLLKMMAGEMDVIRMTDVGGTPNYPVLVQNEEKGNYRVQSFDLPAYNAGNIWINPHHEDPALRDLFLNLTFRQALSVAINRDEVNQLIFKGLAVPTQVSASPGPPYFGDDEFYKQYTQYDPALANKLLDEIGLTEKDGDGYRLRPDGKPLLIVMKTNIEWPQETVEMCELYKKYFAAVGINSVVKPVKNSILYPQIQANDYDFFVRAFIGGGKIQPPLNGYVFPQSTGWHMGPLWAKWILTKGAEGVEPQEWVKELAVIQEKAKSTTDDDERNQLYIQALKMHVENLMPIGALNVGGPGSPDQAIAVTTRFANVQDPVDGHYFSSQVCSWYIKE